MSNSKKLLPFSLGLIAGVAIISVLAFTNNWVVSSKASEMSVVDASITAQAQICASLASDHIKTTAAKEDLDGHQSEARAAREKLAEKFAVVLPGHNNVNGRVISACAQMLNKPTS